MIHCFTGIVVFNSEMEIRCLNMLGRKSNRRLGSLFEHLLESPFHRYREVASFTIISHGGSTWPLVIRRSQVRSGIFVTSVVERWKKGIEVITCGPPFLE
jgi:hypothetical protein